ncbi:MULTISPECIES: DUF308 domain-containing protein [unclassified Halorubrum]|uniref:DUF7319 domain-containing protein n=1 Tax=unclassified Halorubrum TaxID=2642239 RepID=UPI000B9950DA|nr:MULTISPECIES: DUF308 domain-containing protein [unclassified Halorubrum]OYR43665.1 hypothetical protein DJ75_11445 [Halorubrum sp. Eb13]OYR46336.1 hypothetical protein DJ81_03320 [Halorubrum sp. Hd13]OYR50599.1 hypothetical protein DJ74_06385 [Halorubrum sp. Ea8]
MEDTSTGSESEPRPDRSRDTPDGDEGSPGGETSGNGGEPTVEGGAADDLDELRRRVEEEYDFDDFGPSDMAKMSAEEWDAAFDPDSWITGDRLLERAEAELKSRVARREVFGVLERVRADGEERILVYSDEGYAIVRPTGEVAGQGTVLRDIEPIVALAAMESYDVPEPPDDWSLPHPDTVPQGSGEFGNLMVQVIAVVQVLAGAALLVATFLTDLDTIVAPAMGIVFLLVGLFLFVMVANARLSDRFRSEEYRERLRALREAKERPDFVPVEGGVVDEEQLDE